jgi:hypothetical protein
MGRTLGVGRHEPRPSGFRADHPDHFLAMANGVLMRFEQTQHAAAPLGAFALGDGFAGPTAGGVRAVGQGTDGHVFVEDLRAASSASTRWATSSPRRCRPLSPWRRPPCRFANRLAENAHG